MDVITKSTQCPLAYIGIAASKFIPSKQRDSFLKFFKTVKPKNSAEVNPNIEQSKTTSSPEGKTTLKSNFEVAEVKPFAVIKSKDHSVEVKKEKPLAVVIDEDESIRNTEAAAIKKSVATTSETRAKRNKGIIDNLLNKEAEGSPTSRKVFKLMQVCKERDEANSKIKRMSSMAINNNDFQSSFFMNIFKTNKKDCPENIDEDNGTAEETERSEQSTVSSAKNLDTSNDTDNSNLDSCVRDHDHEKPSSSRTSIPVYNTDEDSCKKEFKQESTVQNPSMLLREIFPNLDDIDPDILLLLPPDLQEEARSYVKSRDKKRETIVKVSRDLPAKTAKGKAGKSKATGKAKRRSPLLDNFLIKTDSSEHLQRCAECGQMIPLTRYDEHTDFHVAQNLYQEINKPISGENSGKRKLEESAEVVMSAKRQPNDCKLDRDRSITTFLS